MEENRILELNPRLLYYLGLCCFRNYWSFPYTRTFVELASASSRNLNVRVTFLNNDLWGEDSLKKVKPANLSYQVWISQTQEAEVPSLRISRSFTTWVLKSEDLKKPPEISSLNISRNPSCWIPSEHLKTTSCQVWTSQENLRGIKSEYLKKQPNLKNCDQALQPYHPKEPMRPGPLDQSRKSSDQESA